MSHAHIPVISPGVKSVSDLISGHPLASLGQGTLSGLEGAAIAGLGYGAAAGLGAAGAGAGAGAGAAGAGESLGPLASEAATVTSLGAPASTGVLGTGLSMSDILSGAGKVASLAEGSMALQQSAKQQEMAQNALNQETAAMQPVLNSAHQALSEYAAGTISAPQEAEIAQWADEAKARTRQAYANMGLSGSSQEQSALSQIDQQALGQKQNYIQQNFNNAMNGLGLASNAYSGITRTELQNSQGFSNALQSLGSALGMNKATTTKQGG